MRIDDSLQNEGSFQLSDVDSRCRILDHEGLASSCTHKLRAVQLLRFARALEMVKLSVD